VREAAEKKYSKDFMELSASEKHDLLAGIDNEARNTANPKRTMTPAIIFTHEAAHPVGYFTSEAGSTKALRFCRYPDVTTAVLPIRKVTVRGPLT